MSKRSRRSTSPASHPTSDPKLFTAGQRELNTKRRGELAELAFTLKAARLGFGVSRPFGDSERYDAIIDARQLSANRRHQCQPACPISRALQRRRTTRGVREPEAESRKPPCPALRTFRHFDLKPSWCGRKIGHAGWH